jgi:tripartite-type tricarboxylate transporter receptor subunit TctC
MIKRSMPCLLAAAALAAAPLAGAMADQHFGEVEVPGTIRVIVAYSAGGSSDALARVMLPYWEQAISELSGQSTSAVVVNLPGAGGEIGFTALANADPDGSTIGIINLPSVGLLEAARETAFSPWLEKFEPIGVNVIDPNIIMLSEQSPHESLADAIQAAVDAPGSVIVGADGPLSDDHLAMYALQRETGAALTFIPYAGGAPANRAFRTAEVDINIGNVFDYLQNEDVAKDAAVFGAERYEMVGDVPTLEESIGVHAGELGSTRGLAAPAGTPEDLLELYQEAFRIATENEEYQQAAIERNITIVRPRVGAEFGEIMEEQDDLVEGLLEYFIEGGFIDAAAN